MKLFTYTSSNCKGNLSYGQIGIVSMYCGATFWDQFLVATSLEVKFDPRGRGEDPLFVPGVNEGVNSPPREQRSPLGAN
jgi:hypothetical protein